MARSTSTKEASIVAYFQTAPLAVANTVFGIVRGTMKGRNTPAAVSVAPKKKAVRRSRAKKVVASVPAAQVAAPSPTESISAVA
jgi:hypothetical protein